MPFSATLSFVLFLATLIGPGDRAATAQRRGLLQAAPSILCWLSTGGLNASPAVCRQHLSRFIPGNPRIVAQNMMGGRLLRQPSLNVAPRTVR